MRLAAHQPDLLPWTGVWHKMARCEVFDVAIFDQFQSRGYQRRVMMRGSWASWRLLGKPSLCPITQVRLAPDAGLVLWETIAGRYRGARHWTAHEEWLRGAVLSAADTGLLWMANLDLLLAVRDRLGIETPLAIGRKPKGAGVAGLYDLCEQYGATSYLSGTGATAYLDEWDSDVDLLWSTHAPRHGESVLTTLMDSNDPLAEILEETR